MKTKISFPNNDATGRTKLWTQDGICLQIEFIDLAQQEFDCNTDHIIFLIGATISASLCKTPAKLIYIKLSCTGSLACTGI